MTHQSEVSDFLTDLNYDLTKPINYHIYIQIISIFDQSPVISENQKYKFTIFHIFPFLHRSCAQNPKIFR